MSILDKVLKKWTTTATDSGSKISKVVWSSQPSNQSWAWSLAPTGSFKESFDLKLPDFSKEPAKPIPKQATRPQEEETSNMAYTQEWTLSTGQGVKINQAPDKLQMKLMTEFKSTPRPSEYLNKLDSQSKSILVQWLDREKNRNELISQYDPKNITGTLENDEDAIERARLSKLGYTNNTDYAHFWFQEWMFGWYGWESSYIKPETFWENVTYGLSMAAWTAMNPLSWGLYSWVSSKVTPLLGDTVAGRLTTQWITGWMMWGLWNTWEPIGGSDDIKKRAENAIWWTIWWLVLWGIFEWVWAWINLAKWNEVRLTKGLWVKYWEPGVIWPKQLEFTKYIPETDSFLFVNDELARIGSSIEMNWEGTKTRIWSKDWINKADFEMTPEWVKITTTKYLPEEIQKRVEIATVTDIPSLALEIAKAPVSETPVTPRARTVSYQTTPKESILEKVMKPSEEISKKVIPSSVSTWTDKYFHNWAFDELVLNPSKNVEKFLNNFRPAEPVTLYRWINKYNEDTSYKDFTSWTYDKEIAKWYAWEDWKVEEKIFYPKDIMFDTTKLSDEQKRLVWYDYEIDDKEVLIKINKSEELVQPTEKNQSWQIDYQKIIEWKYWKSLAKMKESPVQAISDLQKYMPPDYEVVLQDRVYASEDDWIGTSDWDEVIAKINYNEKKIYLSKNEVRKSTALHETAHAWLEYLRTSDVERYTNIFKEAEDMWGISMKTSEWKANLEELISEEARYFFDKWEFKTPGLFEKIKDFIRELVRQIKAFLSWEKVKEKEFWPIISEFYDDIISWKFKGDYQTDMGKLLERSWEKFQKLDKKITQKSQTQIAKENMSDVYWEDLTKKFLRVKQAEDNTKKQTSLDKYTDIEWTTWNKAIEDFKLSAQEYLTDKYEWQTTKETIQDVYDELSDILDKKYRNIEDEMYRMVEELQAKELKKEEKKQASKEAIETAVLLKKIFTEQPKVSDLKKFFKEKSYNLVLEWLKYAFQKNMIDRVEFNKLTKKYAISSETKFKNPKWKGLTTDQKMALTDMQGWDKLIKWVETHKINIVKLSEWLKDIDATLHVVETPEGKRVPLPFSLMWNKSATINKIIKPVVIDSIKNQWVKVYVEPYWWAWTSLYVADEYFNAWLEEMHLNFFDKEKYIVQNELQKWINVTPNVNEAWDEIIGKVWTALEKIPVVKELMNEYDIQPGTKDFKDVAQVFFYPKYAEQFFEENPDSKLANKWEITETFKDWLVEKQIEEWLTKEEAEQTVQIILSDTSLFETNYPEISKEIWDILASYDNIDSVNTVDEAIKLTMARHLMQRGNGWQRIVWAVDWFWDVFGVVRKMTKGFENYRRVYERNKWKISIYNEDWKVFIQEMNNKGLNNKASLIYNDPPYVRTTATYVKNAPEVVKNSLGEYADYDKIPWIFKPMSEAHWIFTNDIDWDYFRALDELYWESLWKDILGYREWTTPTSLVTTSEINITPNTLDLNYYRIARGNKVKSVMESLNDIIGWNKALKKEIAKLIKEATKFWNERELKLLNIFEWQEKAWIAFEDLKDRLEETTTGRDKQALLNRAYQLAKEGNLRGSSLIKMVKTIEKLWEDRLENIKEIRKIRDDIKKSKVLDVVSRDNFLEELDAKLEFKKVTQLDRKNTEIVTKGLRWDELSPEEKPILEQYYFDDNFREKIDNLTEKKSIYEMDLDELSELKNRIELEMKYSADQYKYNKVLREWELEKTVEYVKNEWKKLSYNEPLQWNINLMSAKERLNRSKSKVSASFEKLMDEFTWSNRIVEDILNIEKIKDLLDDWAVISRELYAKMLEWDKEIVKKNNLKEIDFIKIRQHHLAIEWDWKGKVLLANQLKFDGADYSTNNPVAEDEIISEINRYASDDYLDERQKEWYEFSQKNYDKLWELIQQTSVTTYNKNIWFVENYAPHIPSYDINKNSKLFSDLRADSLDWDMNIVSNYLTNSTEQWFTITRKGASFYPEMDARGVFLKHIKDATWYAWVQEPLRFIKDVVNKSSEAIWNDWVIWMTNWIDRVARNGKSKKLWPLDKVVEKVGSNLSDAVLIWNVATIGKQMSAIIEWYTTSWKLPVLNLAEVLVPEVWEKYYNLSNFLPYRDLSVEQIHWLNPEDVVKNIVNAIREKWYLTLWIVDKRIGTAFFKAIYDEQISLWVSSEEAVRFADKLVKKAIASYFIEDIPEFIAENRRGITSLWTRFQIPALNHFSNIRLWGWKEAEKKFGKFWKWITTISLSLVLFGLMDAYISELWKKLKGTSKWFDPVKETYWSIIWMFWPAWLLVGKWRYWEYSIQWFSNIVQNAWTIWTWWSKEWDVEKATLNLLKSSTSLLWIPWSKNLFDYMWMLLKDQETTPTTTTTRKRTTRTRLSRTRTTPRERLKRSRER